MYRLIIADDEPWASYRLSRLVDYQQLGFDMAGMADNGNDALALCRSLQPDVLLTDIRMPGLDGLELLKALQPERTEVILISGYADFSYAQQAVRDGAFDYLIKQVSAEQLTAVLIRLKQRLDTAREGTSSLDALMSMLSGEDGLTVGDWVKTYRENTRAPFYRFYTYANDECTLDGLSTFETGHSKRSTLIPCTDETALPEGIGPCGISLAGTDESDFAALFRQSNIAYTTMRFLRLKEPCVYDPNTSLSSAQLCLDEISKALADGNPDHCRQALSSLESVIWGMNSLQLSRLYGRLCELYGMEQDEDMDYLRLSQEFDSPKDMIAFFLDSANAPKQTETNTIEQVMLYIDTYYNQNLRISALAERFHFSPNYFSTLFHKYAGMPITKYLAQKRIQYSIELMTKTQMSLQEIADKSGFGDYFQYSKTFKKYKEITPKQYRKQLIDDND